MDRDRTPSPGTPPERRSGEEENSGAVGPGIPRRNVGPLAVILAGPLTPRRGFWIEMVAAAALFAM
ncbi:MAG: hypothetical protein M3112_05150 [Actinomycetia bacterium]|nr:hypothetical protein [Actinomycetes bacterium]